jgi:hypothetical protein
MKTGHHADALDANGRSLPDKIWRWEMPVLADFSPCRYVLEDKPRPGCLARRTVPVWDDSIDTLAQAREWAAKIMASDDRVASVYIRESVQEYEGCPWKEGRYIETVERPAAPEIVAGSVVEFRTRDGLLIKGTFKYAGTPRDEYDVVLPKGFAGTVCILDRTAAYHYVKASSVVGLA